MILSWLRRRRRKKLLATPFPERWESFLHPLPFYESLSDAERAALRDTLRIIVTEKRWEGCGGMAITDEVRVTIAAQAAVLILGIEHDYYRRVRSILVYPSVFKVPGRVGPDGMMVDGGAPVLGLAQHRGPVVLAWDQATYGGENWEDGHNVVLHEFAHMLDMLDDWADGTPPLESRDQYEAWARIMREEYETLVVNAEKRRATLLDKYGATNPAEFFAVATECFFEKPLQMRRKHSSLYGLLRSYYLQDPAARTEK